MDGDQPSPIAQESLSLGSEGSQASEKEKEEEKLPELPLLSEQLSLDELWDMLGECLKELEESHDQHAVLVLQPAVEAFFLVHATKRESNPPPCETRGRASWPTSKRGAAPLAGPRHPCHAFLLGPLLLPRALVHEHLLQPASGHEEFPALCR
uniref:E3 ubiquitin-protein ligase HUWE1-like n=1 Tax=Pristiophorus japonicus TaxID=55135 RepID=UPI00398F46F5